MGSIRPSSSGLVRAARYRSLAVAAAAFLLRSSLRSSPAHHASWQGRRRRVNGGFCSASALADAPFTRQSTRLRRLITDIKDPEHPYSLEELNVVTEDSIEVSDRLSHVTVAFTPTVEHCSLAAVIGLCLRVKLMQTLPPYYKVDMRVAPGSHASEAAVNKQLNDKELLPRPWKIQTYCIWLRSACHLLLPEA